MKTKLLKFWNKYKVFILGLLGSIAVSLQELLTTNSADADLKVYGFAILMTALSYIATQWRGKGITILGILGTLSSVFVTMQQTGNFTWTQFITFSVAALLAAVAPPPKPREKFWHVSLLSAQKEEAQKPKVLSSPEDKPMRIFISNPNEYGLVLEANYGNRRSTYKLYHSEVSANNLIATLVPTEGMAVLSDSYEPSIDNGRPMVTNKDYIKLLGEVKTFVESTPGLAKNSRWEKILKPTIESLLELVRN